MFLMASKKRPNNKTSNYLISMGEGDFSRDGTNYLGKLRSNFVGTEFQVRHYFNYFVIFAVIDQYSDTSSRVICEHALSL
jgi:Tub family